MRKRTRRWFLDRYIIGLASDLKGLAFRARIALHVLEQKLLALPEEDQAAFAAHLSRKAAPAQAESKAEAKGA